MVKKLAAVTMVAAASVGILAAPAAAATCSYLYCYQYGTGSGTVWTNLGPLGASVTVQSPVWAIVPPPPA